MNPSTLSPMPRAARLDAARDELAARDLDAVVVSDSANLRYLTGFTGSAGQLVLTQGSAVLTTDGRYRDQAAEELERAQIAGRVEVIVDRPAAQDEAAISHLAGAARVGLESASVSWQRAQQWQRLLPDAEVDGVADLLEVARSRKDVPEIERITAAAHIADTALARCIGALGTGVTELEFARLLDHTMLSSGADALSFETICAAGPNGAKPHARPSSRPIGQGDLVVLDFGAMVDGYHSDMTRSFVIGEPDDAQEHMLASVREAQARGVEAVRPGATCAEVDAACRSYLDEVGLGHEFVHGTGHGVGLVIHEAPWVNAQSDTELLPGHVVTVEPGVYRPGFGGVRVEDLVVVTETGARAVSTSPKDPVVDAG